jgi:hypothetical protein
VCRAGRALLQPILDEFVEGWETEDLQSAVEQLLRRVLDMTTDFHRGIDRTMVVGDDACVTLR